MPTTTLPTNEAAAAPHASAAAPWLREIEEMQRVARMPLFFIVGCQKSGTTWIKHLLNSHTEICCFGEAAFWPALMPRLAGALKQYNHDFRAAPSLRVSNEQAEALLATTMCMVLANALRENPARVLGEKTPDHALLTPLLAKLFPQAKFVHIIRDGRDACTSGWYHNQRTCADTFNKRFANLAAYARYFAEEHWVPYIQTVRELGASQPERVFELRYEDLHAEPEPLIRDLLAFLAVDASGAAIAQCHAGGAFTKLSGGRARGASDNASFYRKGVVGDWRNLFGANDLAAFEQLAGPLLRECGYQSD